MLLLATLRYVILKENAIFVLTSRPSWWFGNSSLQWRNVLNRSWRISTTPKTPKFFFIRSKRIQGFNIVILSCLAKKNQNLNARKKSSVYYWKGRFVGVSGLKTHLSLINWTFFPRIQILIFHCEATQYDHIRSLYEFGTDKKKFGCVGSCGYAPDSVK